MIMDIGRETCWVEGISTANFTDDSKISIFQDLEVVGQKQYTTVLGAVKTVWSIKPVDLTKERAEAHKRDQREWTSSDGKFKTVGTLIAANAEHATLAMHDGKPSMSR